MLKIIRQDKNPKILVATPLLTGHKISKETLHSIKRNEISYVWASYESQAKHSANVQNLIDEFSNKYSLPPYIFVLDDDIILGRYLLDRMFECLYKTADMIAFAYCPFSYSGHINISFPPIEYDIEKLKRGNYISSNSLYRAEAIKKVGGFVIEEKYQRLSDHAMFLKLFRYGYIGKLYDKTAFTAISKKTDISAGSTEEYQKTFQLIQEDFIKPISK